MIVPLDINVALLFIVLTGLLLVLAYCSRWKRYFELGMKLPGPPGLPIIGNGLQFTTNDLIKLAQQLKEFARSYTPVARLWFGPVLVVSLTDPDSIERLVRQDKLLGRGYLVRKLGEPVFQNGLLCSEGDKWRRNRKILTSGFQVNILERLVENFAKNSDILANKLKALADGVTAHDVTRHLMRCTLDIIIQTTSRTDINAQNDNNDSTLNSITTIVDTIGMRTVKPWLYIDWIYKATEQGKKFYRAVKHCHDLILDEIEIANRKIETVDKRDIKLVKNSLIDHIMQYGDIKNEDIVGEIASIIGAGTETTSVACGFVLALLGENQHIQERVMQEQQDIFGDDILRTVTSGDLPRMVYLDQVLKEALRMFPPSPMVLRDAIKEIDLGNGHIIPAGTNIMISAYSVHRDPRHFPDPEKFDPERFSPQNTVGRHPYAYIPFGIGRRMCVGHMFATMEVKTILSTVLRRYCITEIVGGIKGIDESLKVSFVATPANGFRVKLLPRPHPLC